MGNINKTLQQNSESDSQRYYLEHAKIIDYITIIEQKISKLKALLSNLSKKHPEEYDALLKQTELFEKHKIEKNLIQNDNENSLFEYKNIVKINKILKQLLYTLGTANKLQSHTKEQNKKIKNFLQNISENTITALYYISISDDILYTTRDSIKKALLYQEQLYDKTLHNMLREISKSKSLKTIQEYEVNTTLFITPQNMIEHIKELLAIINHIKSQNNKAVQIIKKGKEIDIVINKTDEQNNEDIAKYLSDLLTEALIQTQEVDIKFKSNKNHIQNFKKELERIMQLLQDAHSKAQKHILNDDYPIDLYRTICHKIQNIFQIIVTAHNTSNTIKNVAYMHNMYLAIEEICNELKRTNATNKQQEINGLIEKIQTTLNKIKPTTKITKKDNFLSISQNKTEELLEKILKSIDKALQENDSKIDEINSQKTTGHEKNAAILQQQNQQLMLSKQLNTQALEKIKYIHYNYLDCKNQSTEETENDQITKKINEAEIPVSTTIEAFKTKKVNENITQIA